MGLCLGVVTLAGRMDGREELVLVMAEDKEEKEERTLADEAQNRVFKSPQRRWMPLTEHRHQLGSKISRALYF